MRKLTKTPEDLIAAYMDFLEKLSTPEKNLNYEFNEYFKARLEGTI